MHDDYLVIPTLELPTEDGEPLESDWHRAEINLLIESLRQHWQGRTDYFVGGNMFVYFDLDQAQRREYRGPDFFVVRNVDGSYTRKAWVVWKEGGRYPDLIVELLSPSTAQVDLMTKKDLYERTFHTSEYFCYDPEREAVLGWRLGSGGYVALAPNEQGWLWSEQLGLWLGQWGGGYLGEEATWLRFYTSEGALVEITAEVERHRAETERRRAEVERQRAERAEAELERLRARLRELGLDPD